MRFSILSFLTLAVAASTVAAQPAKRAVSPNPPHSQNKHVDLAALPPVDVGPMTNAKRFARGLPPLNPTKRGPHQDGGYHHGGTRVGSAPRSETSPSPQAGPKCNILVKTTDGTTLGFIASSFNDFGEYGTPISNQQGAVEFSLPKEALTSSSLGQINLVAASAPDAINSFPYFSGAVGFMSDSDNLGPGSFNYIAITGNSGPMDPGSRPSSSTSNSYTTRTGQEANSETAIWTYDATTGAVQAVWVNSDGNLVPTTFVYFIDDETDNGTSNTLLATGDYNAFKGLFGCTDTCRSVTFTCVPPSGSE